MVLTGCEPLSLDSMKKASPIKLTKTQTEILSNINAFSFQLYQKEAGYANTDANMVLSPYSVSQVLAMLSHGAEGNTRNEIINTLGISGFDYKDVGAFYSKLTKSLSKADASAIMSTSNSIWFNNDIWTDIKPTYINDVESYYSAECRKTDLASASCVKEINDWCSENTQKRIPKLLNNPPGGKMAVANALYFNGSWQKKFTGTQSVEFKHLDGSIETKSMMKEHQDVFMGRVRINNTGMASYISIPYGNGAFAMEILMPEDDSFLSCRASMDSDVLSLCRRESSLTYHCLVAIPTFDVEYGTEEMRKSLEALGIKQLFSETGDFNRISDTKISFGNVIHKANISVNREGTTAAAATVITAPTAPMPTSFIVDRPFIFMISEKSTGAVLFIGQYI